MRWMVKFSIPASAGNDLVGTGKIGQVFHSLMEDFKPEAAYFFPENGQRGGIMVIDVTDSSELVKVAESFWFGLKADISVTPVMSAEDLGKGLGGIEGLVKRYT
jgi:hypothetical protein